MFFMYQGRLAAWAPPDVRLGPASLLGRPPTPGADEKIGRALLAAWELRRWEVAVNTPFHLRKTDEPAAVAGLLLVGGRAADLLALVAALGPGRRPVVHAAPGGFLVKLAGPPPSAFPGTIRLRALAADLFLPADAVVLALLPDEAAALVRERGLVFLPGGRVLGYAVGARWSRPAAGGASAAGPGVASAAGPAGACPERLREIVLDLPDDTPDAVLRPGGAAIGVEDPRPQAAGPLATVGGAAQFGLGRLLMGLGGLLRMKAIARLGAEMVGSAVEQAPRLSEAVLGRQEAALRALLREFREGDLERALRRACRWASRAAGAGSRLATPSSLSTSSCIRWASCWAASPAGRTSGWEAVARRRSWRWSTARRPRRRRPAATTAAPPSSTAGCCATTDRRRPCCRAAVSTMTPPFCTLTRLKTP